MKSAHCPTVGLLLLLAFGAGCSTQPIQMPEVSARVQAAKTSDYYAMIKLGEDKMSVGNYDAAIAAYDQAIAVNPDLPVGYACRGQARQMKGDLKGAMSDYTRVPDGDPYYAIAYVGRGEVRLALGDTSGANRDYQQAATLAPNNAQVFTALAQARINQGDLEGAIQAATRAIALDPRLEPAYIARAIAERHKHDHAAALADYSHILSMYPRDAGALYNRGAVETDMGNFDGALADFRQAIVVYPNNSFAYNGIAGIRELKGDFAGAQEAYLKSIAVEPWRAKYNRFFLTLILRRRHLDESPAGLSEAINHWPEGWAKTVGLFLLGRINETTLFAAAKTGTPKDVREQHCEADYYAGMMHLLANDSTTAKTLFTQCLATGVSDFHEYRLAQTELARLGASQSAAIPSQPITARTTKD